MERNIESDRNCVFAYVANVNKSYAMFPLERVTVQKVFYSVGDNHTNRQ